MTRSTRAMRAALVSVVAAWSLACSGLGCESSMKVSMIRWADAHDFVTTEIANAEAAAKAAKEGTAREEAEEHVEALTALRDSIGAARGVQMGDGHGMRAATRAVISAAIQVGWTSVDDFPEPVVAGTRMGFASARDCGSPDPP